jgi:hypothetical protein
MGVPTSEVGYISATTGRGDHEVHKRHVVALREKNCSNTAVHYCKLPSNQSATIFLDRTNISISQLCFFHSMSELVLRPSVFSCFPHILSTEVFLFIFVLSIPLCYFKV